MLVKVVKDNQPVLSPYKASVICEIPIYGTSQDKYNQYWDLKADEFVNECLEISPNRQDICELRNCILKEIMWKYNQIIGFIRISLNGNDVNFEEFISLSQYRRNSKLRSLIQYNKDFHFYIGNSKSNIGIANKIKEYIYLYKKDKLKEYPNYYFDMSIFNNIIDNLDFLNIIKENK